MITNEEKEVKIDVDGKHSISVLHYKSVRDQSWHTRIDLPEGSALRTLDEKRAIKLCVALLTAIATMEGINSGAGETTEEKLYEDMTMEPATEVWLYGDAVKCQGWTCDLHPLETGHWAYCLCHHRGPNYTSCKPMHGAYEDQYHAIQAAILELRDFRW